MFSAIGGLFGTVVLIVAAPALAEFALKFSSFEYFWLVLLGLTCAVFISSDRPLKGFVSLLLGLLIASVGLNNPAAFPRFTFGNTELLGGIGLIPLMIGMFAVSEIIRYAVDTQPAAEIVDQPIGNVFKGMWGLAMQVPDADPARQHARHAGRRAARRRRRHRGLDVLRDQQELLEGAGEVRHRPRRGHRRERARPTTARSPARGSRRWCSAFRATRSRRS